MSEWQLSDSDKREYAFVFVEKLEGVEFARNSFVFKQSIPLSEGSYVSVGNGTVFSGSATISAEDRRIV